MAKKGLGKGLGALIDTTPSQEPPKKHKPISAQIASDTSGITYMKPSEIEPNKKQPRRDFDEEKINALAESIKENGLIQPIIVSQTALGMYKIVAGERRWRAAKRAKLKTIPVLVREYSDEQIAEIALIENLQREDLNPIEEALGYNLLMEEFSMTQEDVSKKVGKSRSAVANTLRLLALPNEVKDALIKKQITSGHARAILSVEDHDLQKAMLKIIIDDDLNVRQAEALSKQITKKKPSRTQKKLDDATLLAIADLEGSLSQAFGTKVKISTNGKRGKIEISYLNNDDLDRIIRLFKM
ncbi:MAG: ParB/RepB/Spo0J family partition protein [Clostridia bacterium]|nr:ParB/RepB/Spo0J family partition protein [Clostridia bacterium]